MAMDWATRWLSVVLLGAGASGLVACTSGGFGDGGSGMPRARGGDPVVAPASGITAEETGEVVRVRWARDTGFRGTHQTPASAQAARFEVQHSTTGAWAGEETVLTRQMSRRPALSMWKYYSEGTETSVPPLEDQEQYGLEEFIHHAPVRGMNYYRFREVEWHAGRVRGTGGWSATASVNYTGRDVPRLPASVGEYSPGELPALIVSQIVGNSAAADVSVSFSAVAARQRGGPAAWGVRFAELQGATGLRSGAGAIGWCIKDLGVRKVLLDDGESRGTSGTVRVGSLPRPTGAYPPWDPASYERVGAFADDATMSLPEVWWRGLEHIKGAEGLASRSAVEGAKLQAFVERYGEWDDGLVGPKFVYCGCPFTENGSFETEVLTAKSHMRPIVAASHYVIMGTTATAQIRDEATGTLTAAARFIAWWHESYPGRWIFVEPGLRRQRCRQWMEPNDYPFVGSWQTIDNLFDQDVLAKSRRLVLRKGGRGTTDDALDPRDYPERRHIVYVGSNVCPYVAAGKDNEDKVQRIIEVCVLLYGFDPSLIVQIGDVGVLEDMRPDQAAMLVRVAERAAAGRSGR